MEMHDTKLEELINRYVYDVVRRLPQSQRADIEHELRELIEDMLLDKVGENEPMQQDVEKVLLQLGKPADLADKYRDEKRYVIGPAYYDTYCMVLKIVLLCVGVGVGVAQSINCIFSSGEKAIQASYEIVPSILSGLMQGFAWVTILFFIFERYGKKVLDSRHLGGWKLSDLPLIPSEKAIIKKSEPIVGIIFSFIFFILLNVSPQLFGAYFFENGILRYSVSIFDLQVFKGLLPLINLCFVIGIIKELLKLVAGKYSLKLSIAMAGLNVISMVVTCMIFANRAIWNSNFITQIQSAGVTIAQDINLQGVLSIVTSCFVAIIVFAFLVDTATVLYKGLRADGRL